MAQQTGAIYHQGILYSGGGGTNVTPNPQGEATDTLNTVEIDGTIYDIEGGGGGGSNLIIDAQKYSLEEQVVGIWTDGKPLYQKTFYTADLDYTSTRTNKNVGSISGIDMVVSLTGILSNSSKTQRYEVPFPFANSGNLTTLHYVYDDNCIYFSSTTTWGDSDLYVTILYTKTTDVAGSGGYQAYGFSPIIYSEVEREVGVWMNGKPLYQKTWSGLNVTPSYNSWTNIIPNDVNIETIVGYQALNSNLNLDGIGIEWQALSDYIRAEYVQNTSIRTIGSLTLLYTKTTDVAGSGEYNTLAIPNVHYSTEEQVIGTWIDEKTLYQKTCATPLTLNTGSGEKTYTLDISNVDKVISVDYSVGINALSVNVTRTDTPDEIRARINQGNQLLVWSGYDRSTLTIYTTMKYTKTTD